MRWTQSTVTCIYIVQGVSEIVIEPERRLFLVQKEVENIKGNCFLRDIVFEKIDFQNPLRGDSHVTAPKVTDI